jgi:hypothetical protein
MTSEEDMYLKMDVSTNGTKIPIENIIKSIEFKSKDGTGTGFTLIDQEEQRKADKRKSRKKKTKKKKTTGDPYDGDSDREDREDSLTSDSMASDSDSFTENIVKEMYRYIGEKPVEWIEPRTNADAYRMLKDVERIKNKIQEYAELIANDEI